MRLLIICTLLYVTDAYTIQIPCIGCEYKITTHNGVTDGIGPALYELQPWEQAHVSAEGILTEHTYIPIYDIPADACSTYGGLSILAHCGGNSVLVVSIFVIVLALFTYASLGVYRRKNHNTR